ncbi:MAG: MFS transporter [Candidatus Aramenus sp.]|jgi:NNP family nitrate/nitrite transporter-like MFS transporter|nr:MFS transporter [Candidatus Aramenus sp.]
MEVLKKEFGNLAIPTYAFFITFVAWTAYSPLGSVFFKEFHLNFAELGLLLGLPKLMALPTRYVFGYLSDRIGARLSLILVTALSSLAVGLTGFSSSLVQLYASATLLGVAGGTFPVGIAYISRKFKAMKGTLLGVYGGLGNFGSSVSGLIIPVLFLSLGFKLTFVALALMVASSAVLSLLLEDDELRVKGRVPAMALVFLPISLGFLVAISFLKLSLAELLLAEISMVLMAFAFTYYLHDKTVTYLSYLYFVSFGGFLAVGLWVPSLFSLIFGLKLVSSGLILFAYGATTIAFRPLGGALGDVMGGMRATKLSFLFISLSSALFSYATFLKDLELAIASVVLLGASLSLTNGAVFKAVSETQEASKVGEASGIIGGLAGFGGFAITALLGFIDEVYPFASPLLLAVMCLGVIVR